MADWEKQVYAVPGDSIHWPQAMKFSRPLFYNPPNGPLIDDLNVNELITVKPFTQLLVVAVFPEGVPRKPNSRGAVVLVPNRGVWWWRWP